MKKLILILMIMALMIPFAQARENVGSQTLLFNKPTVRDYKLIDVNSISAWVTNYGSIFRHPTTGNSGFEYPAGGEVFAIYAAGIWVGARPVIDGEPQTPRVAVAEYSYEYQPGKIIEGSPDDPDLTRYQVYKWLGTDTPDADAVADGAPETLLGDQYLWSVYNDGDASYHVNMGTGPLMLEVQQSIFAFARTGPLGNTVFMKWLVINKHDDELRDTYITIWCDPDLGDSGDDFVGSDTLLSLGYCYNSSNVDGEYGDAPPAVGFDFFQGPIVPSPGDTAYVSGQMFLDYKNLPMSSFVYYDNSNENNGNPQTGPECYNYMQAKWRDGIKITRGGTGIDPEAPPTNFMYPGDPESGEGWLDSSPADRRFMMTTGPFTLEPWVDTNGNGKEDIGEPGVQEIVAGAVVARGTNNLNSVTLLKQYDELAQLAYDLNFYLAAPPPAPAVEITQMDREIVLKWANQDLLVGVTYEEVEAYDANDPLVPRVPDDHGDLPDTTYTFQGYLVYQFDFLDRRNASLIGNYDLADGIIEVRDFVLDVGTGEFLEKLVWKGTDSGLKREQIIAEDKFATGSVPTLINGKRYWFGVVALGYNEASSPKTITSPLIDGTNFVEVVPQFYPIGTSVDQGIIGDIISSVKVGVSDGTAFGMVVDPTQLTGHEYEMEFLADADGEPFWNLIDLNTTDTVLDSQYHQGVDSVDAAGPIADGIRWQAIGPSAGIHGVWQTSNAAGPIGPECLATECELENIFWINSLYTEEWPPTEQVAGGWFFQTWGGGTPQDETSFNERVFRGTNWSHAAGRIFEMRFTADAAQNGMGYRRFEDGLLMGNVPFELWDMGSDADDTSDDYRMLPAVLSNGPDVDAYDFGYDDENSSAANDPQSDWVYWGKPDDTSPGQAAYEAWIAPGIGNAPSGGWTEVIARTTLMNWNGYASHEDTVLITDFPNPDTLLWTDADTTFMLDRGWYLDPDNDLGKPTFSADTVIGLILHLPEVGTTYRWITNSPNGPGVSYTFQAPAAPVEDDPGLAKADIEKITVYPNPYYGTHSSERLPTEQWVEFTHLPPTCTIRIFNLAGVLVRTIERTNVTEITFERWDLHNESELPVASGLYIYHIDVPGIGEKIGKLVVFMPEERLDTF